MLCILYLTVTWTKNDRNPKGSLVRKQYIKPYPVDTFSVSPEDDDIFLTELHYEQHGTEMNLQNSRGTFALNEINFRNIAIEQEDDSYRIKWHEDEIGDVRRRGGNEDFKRKGARLRSYPNLMNETAFVLKPGQAGSVCWNNRYTSYYGQKSLHYQIYYINTDSLDVDMFIRDYDYEYKQLADLF